MTGVCGEQGGGGIGGFAANSTARTLPRYSVIPNEVRNLFLSQIPVFGNLHKEATAMSVAQRHEVAKSIAQGIALRHCGSSPQSRPIRQAESLKSKRLRLMGWMCDDVAGRYAERGLMSYGQLNSFSHSFSIDIVVLRTILDDLVARRALTEKITPSRINRKAVYDKLHSGLFEIPPYGRNDSPIYKERGRGRHGGNKYLQNGNSISRRVCPFCSTHVAQSFRTQRSEVRNLFRHFFLCNLSYIHRKAVTVTEFLEMGKMMANNQHPKA